MKQAIMIAMMCGIAAGAHAQTARRQTPQPNPPAQTDTDTAQNAQPDSTQTRPHRAHWGQFGGFHSFTSPPSR